MAKDPAFLFYPGDWLGGTITFSRFLKGCYMDLLMAQFNSGHLSLEEIKTVLGSDFGQAWPALRKKFVTDQEGLFFNERLEVEKNARQKYVESRKKNRDVNTYETHMSTHMENENRNKDKIEIKGVQGEKNLSDQLREKIGKWTYAGFMEYSHILPEDKKTELVRWLIHLKEKDKPPGASTIRELVGDFQSRSLEDIRDRVSNAIKNNSNGSLWSERKIEKQKFGAVPSSY